MPKAQQTKTTAKQQAEKSLPKTRKVELDDSKPIKQEQVKPPTKTQPKVDAVKAQPKKMNVVKTKPVKSSTKPLTLKQTTQNQIEKTFSAKVSKGYIPKVVFDAMATNLSRIIIQLTKRGIYIRMADRDEITLARSMWNIEWERKKFAEYKCVKDETIIVNAKHLQKMLKNVKKKESITFYITKDKPDLLFIVVEPTTGQTGCSRVKAETVKLGIQRVKTVAPDLPDNYIDSDGKTCSAYGNPIVINAVDFQKIKKLTGVCKTSILVTIQKDNYLQFQSGDETVMGLDLEFGELTENPNEDSDEDNEDEEDESEDEDIDESENQEDIEEEDEEYEDEEYEDEEEECEEYPHVYSKEYDISLFAPLIKLPGMCSQMEFYAPKVNGYPLKVNMAALSGLGDTTVYIKDRESIEMIESKIKK